MITGIGVHDRTDWPFTITGMRTRRRRRRSLLRRSAPRRRAGVAGGMMSEGGTPRFGDFTFDPARQSLSGPAGPITLRRKSADFASAADADRVVGKEELSASRRERAAELMPLSRHSRRRPGPAKLGGKPSFRICPAAMCACVSAGGRRQRGVRCQALRHDRLLLLQRPTSPPLAARDNSDSLRASTDTTTRTSGRISSPFPSR